MKKGMIAKITLSVLGGHLAAFALLFFGALWAANLNSTEKITVYLAYLALGVGFLCCGFISRKAGAGIVGALISGFLYALTLLLVSLIGASQGSMPIGVRLAVLFSGALISALISLIPSKKGNKGYSLKKKRSAVNKYIEGK